MNPELSNILNLIGQAAPQFTEVRPITIKNVINQEYRETPLKQPETLHDRATQALDLATKLQDIAKKREEVGVRIARHIHEKASYTQQLLELQRVVEGYEEQIAEAELEQDKLLSDYEDVAKRLGAVRLT